MALLYFCAVWRSFCSSCASPALAKTERITGRQFLSYEGIEDWRPIWGGGWACAYFRIGIVRDRGRAGRADRLAPTGLLRGGKQALIDFYETAPPPAIRPSVGRTSGVEQVGVGARN